MRQRTKRHIGARAKWKKDNGPHEQRCTKVKEHKNREKMCKGEQERRSKKAMGHTSKAEQ